MSFAGADDGLPASIAAEPGTRWKSAAAELRKPGGATRPLPPQALPLLTMLYRHVAPSQFAELLFGRMFESIVTSCTGPPSQPNALLVELLRIIIGPSTWPRPIE
jgi:hypothetical protein